MTLEEYCIEMNIENILTEWDTELNSGYSPQVLSSFSHHRVWWRCENGHEWQAEIKDRVSKHSACPYCMGRLPVKGLTDLATLYPALAKEWHPNKNKGMLPEDVTIGTDKAYWWLCENGHEWKATVGNRALKGNACPYCSGKKAWPGYNDLATLYPDLMTEWYFDYNAGLNPQRLRPHSRKRAYWICPDGHIWNTYIFNRTSKKPSGCPICAGNIRKGSSASIIDIQQLRMEAKMKKNEMAYDKGFASKQQKILNYKDAENHVRAQ